MIKLYDLESGAQYHTKFPCDPEKKALCCFFRKWILVIFM